MYSPDMTPRTWAAYHAATDAAASLQAFLEAQGVLADGIGQAI